MALKGVWGTQKDTHTQQCFSLKKLRNVQWVKTNQNNKVRLTTYILLLMQPLRGVRAH